MPYGSELHIPPANYHLQKDRRNERQTEKQHETNVNETPQNDNWPVQGVILHAEVVPWKVARWIPQVVVLVPQNSLAATHIKPIAKIKTRINQQQQKWLKSLLLCLCGIFWVIIHSLVSFSFLFCTGALGLVPFQMINTHRLSVCCRTHINPQQ